MITVLAGGTGSVKLVRGLSGLTTDFAVVCNVGDNFWLHGLCICPDIDTIVYGLAGILNKERGWGIEGDTFGFMEHLEKFGFEAWFKLGDRDLATHLVRTKLLSSGMTLSEVTGVLCRKLGVQERVLPPTNDRLETWIRTDKHETIHIQEYWVKRRAGDDVLGVEYRGIEKAEPSSEFLQVMDESEGVLICPGNPVTSILPMVSIKGVRERLREKRVVAVSPMIGNAPFSGPAGKLMKSLNVEVSSLGVAKLYKDSVKALLIHRDDANLMEPIHSLGIQPVLEDTLMEGHEGEARLAKSALRSLGHLR